MDEPAQQRRMALRGLHHVTAICRDLDRTTAFYRDLLGLALVHQQRSDDDPEARHFWFGANGSEPGSLVSFLEYPSMAPGQVGVGSTHHFAFVVDSADEQEAWRDYLRGHGVQCTDVFDRGASARSTCATPTATSSRSPPEGPASHPPDTRRGGAVPPAARVPAVL